MTPDEIESAMQTVELLCTAHYRARVYVGAEVVGPDTVLGIARDAVRSYVEMIAAMTKRGKPVDVRVNWADLIRDKDGNNV